MARWKLLQPHYLNIPGTTWEYRETDRTTGRPIRREFPVPTFLHPEDASYWNYKTSPEEGYIAVATKPSDEFPKDLIFSGSPTPDMEPLDDEARAITDSLKSKWGDGPIEGLPAQGGYSQSLLDNLQRQAAEAQTKPQPAAIEGMTELLSTMAAMIKQNTEIMAELAASRAGVAGGTPRRV